MALKIFDTDSAQAAEKKTYNFSDDVVGRFRSGYQIDGRPQALGAWRITTGDPDVANAVHALLGGDEPQEWEAQGEDNIEVFTAAASVDILLDGPDAIRQQMVLRNRNGDIIRAGDGEVLTYPDELAGQPDPEANLSFAERKENARSGMGASPETDIFFRLKDNPDLGRFRFRSGSWGLVSDLHYFGVIEQIQEISENTDGAQIRARLGLKEESFIAKTGARKGQKVSFTKPTLRVLGPVK